MIRGRLAETLPRLVAGVLALATSPLPARAADVVYLPPTDYTEVWARNIALVLVAAAMALLLYALLFRRGRLAAYTSKWLLFLGVCVVPFPVMILSSAVGLDQAKAVAFCESCHAMRAFVSDMEDPGSARLAAVHFKNRYIQNDHCYTCHTDYGLFGTVEAKIGGLSHIWRETAGTYRLPVRTKGPYRFTICLNCHGQSQKFAARKPHRESLEKILRGEASCTDCHGPSHPPQRERS